jgi:hypothetical protein
LLQDLLAYSGPGIAMFLMVEVLVLSFAAAVYAPNTPLGKMVRAALIEAPVKVLKRATPLKVIAGLIVFLIFVAFMFGAPEWIALMGAGDLWIYLDITVVTMLVGSAARLKYVAIQAIQVSRAIVAGAVTRFNRIGAYGRRLRLRRPKLPLSSDETGPEWDWAIA